MTKREIERRAATLLRQYEKARDNAGPMSGAAVSYTNRMIAVLALAEALGCKRARIVAAVRASEEVQS